MFRDVVVQNDITSVRTGKYMTDNDENENSSEYVLDFIDEGLGNSFSNVWLQDTSSGYRIFFYVYLKNSQVYSFNVRLRENVVVTLRVSSRSDR